MQLSDMFIYPVKSLRGCAVTTIGIDPLGFSGDRRFMVVDETGRFLTQRLLPRMALIETALSSTRLTLSIAGTSAVSVASAADPTAPKRTVTVWDSTGLIAEDCGDDVAAWLSSALGIHCRLVRAGPLFHRALNQPDRRAPEDLVTFADAYPFLVIGEASLADLNDRLVAQGGETLTMHRFRPNLVFTGGAPFAEDEWNRFRIGDVVFRTAGACARCTVINVDPLTAERGPEPLRALASYRRKPTDSSEVMFGQNVVHETKTGTLHVGQPIEIID